MLIHSLFLVKAKKIIIILQGNAHHSISKDHLLYWETKRLLLDGFHFKDVLTCNNCLSFQTPNATLVKMQMKNINIPQLGSAVDIEVRI